MQALERILFRGLVWGLLQGASYLCVAFSLDVRATTATPLWIQCFTARSASFLLSASLLRVCNVTNLLRLRVLSLSLFFLISETSLYVSMRPGTLQAVIFGFYAGAGQTYLAYGVVAGLRSPAGQRLTELVTSAVSRRSFLRT